MCKLVSLRNNVKITKILRHPGDGVLSYAGFSFSATIVQLLIAINAHLKLTSSACLSLTSGDRTFRANVNAAINNHAAKFMWYENFEVLVRLSCSTSSMLLLFYDPVCSVAPRNKRLNCSSVKWAFALLHLHISRYGFRSTVRRATLWVSRKLDEHCRSLCCSFIQNICSCNMRRLSYHKSASNLAFMVTGTSCSTKSSFFWWQVPKQLAHHRLSTVISLCSPFNLVKQISV